jgi:hypothetical protein
MNAVNRTDEVGKIDTMKKVQARVLLTSSGRSNNVVNQGIGK